MIFCYHFRMASLNMSLNGRTEGGEEGGVTGVENKGAHKW